MLVDARGLVKRKSPRGGCDDGRAAAESDDGIRRSTNPYAEGARSFLACSLSSSPAALPASFLGLSWFTLYFAWAVFVWRFFMQSPGVHLARATLFSPLVSFPLSAFLYSFAYYSARSSADATRPLLALIFYAHIPPICIYLSLQDNRNIFFSSPFPSRLFSTPCQFFIPISMSFISIKLEISRFDSLAAISNRQYVLVKHPAVSRKCVVTKRLFENREPFVFMDGRALQERRIPL